ncbi:MAG: NADH-ubiquinone oxidoreductase-F iron-sulfur binding region domain-containing protein [Streptosporangiaceae bacterium]
MTSPSHVRPAGRPHVAIAAEPLRLPRLLPAYRGAGPVSLADHLDRYGPPAPPVRAARMRGELIGEVELAGLAGRGGAGFPTARKLAAVAARRNAVVIGNGTEGEPVSAKDKVLMAQSPHLVLDGAAAAASLVGATQVIIVAHPAVADLVMAAARERRRARIDQVRLTIVPAADAFVAGEASAVVHWLEHKIPKPKATPRRLSEQGLHGRPTLVQNVETLAHLALITRYGAAWFRAVGTPREPGSMLVTLAGAVRRPGVYEVEIGMPVGAVLDLAGGPSMPLGGLLVGGYFGTWVDPVQAADQPLSSEGLAKLPACLGAGLLGALPADVCGLAEAARIARYLASESAGQCGPCVFGLDAIAGQLELLASGRGPDLVALRRWIRQLGHGRGACKHPDGTVAMVASAMRTFGGEIERHASGWCCGVPGRTSALSPAVWRWR